MNLVIYQNEANLLSEEIKKKFKAKYKHFNLRIYYLLENEILQGITLEVEEPLLHIVRGDHYTLSGLFSAGDFVEYTMIKLNDIVINILKSYYGDIKL